MGLEMTDSIDGRGSERNKQRILPSVIHSDIVIDDPSRQHHSLLLHPESEVRVSDLGLIMSIADELTISAGTFVEYPSALPIQQLPGRGPFRLHDSPLETLH
jgi:hypothetical protein